MRRVAARARRRRCLPRLGDCRARARRGAARRGSRRAGGGGGGARPPGAGFASRDAEDDRDRLRRVIVIRLRRVIVVVLIGRRARADAHGRESSLGRSDGTACSSRSRPLRAGFAGYGGWEVREHEVGGQPNDAVARVLDAAVPARVRCRVARWSPADAELQLIAGGERLDPHARFVASPGPHQKPTATGWLTSSAAPPCSGLAWSVVRVGRTKPATT
jgi:hypothetical protein